MLYKRSHPSCTAFCRDLQRELFVLDHAKEYGDNIFIELVDDQGQSRPRTTLGALKIEAFDELMTANVVDRLRAVIEQMREDCTDGNAASAADRVLRETKRFSADWK